MAVMHFIVWLLLSFLGRDKDTKKGSYCELPFTTKILTESFPRKYSGK